MLPCHRHPSFHLPDGELRARVFYSGNSTIQKEEETLFLADPDSGMVIFSTVIIPGDAVSLSGNESSSLILESFDPSIFQLFKVDSIPVSYRVVDGSSSILASSDKPLYLQIVSTGIADDRGIGVFEPGSLARVTSVSVLNPSNFVIPAGTLFHCFGSVTSLPSVPAKSTTEFPLDLAYELPNHKNIIAEEVTFESTIILKPYLTLCGRGFETQESLIPLKVRNPVHVEEFELSRHMEMGVEYSMEMRVVNVSTSDMLAEEVIIELQDSSGAIDFSYKGVPVGDSFAVPIEKFSDREVFIAMTLNDSAEDVLTDITSVFVNVVVYGCITQTFTRNVRLIPSFVNTQYHDILLVTCSAIRSDEYKFWRNKFDMLGLTFTFWDIELNGGLRHEGVCPWLHKCSTVVFPYFSWCFRRGIHIEVSDFVSHFSHQDDDSKPSMLCYGTSMEELDWLLFDYTHPCLVHECSKVSILKLFGSGVSDKSIISRCDKFSKPVLENNLALGYASKSVISKDLSRFGPRLRLGTLNVYKSTLSLDSNLFTVDRSSEDCTKEDSTSITLALLQSMGLEQRLDMMFSAKDCFGSDFPVTLSREALYLSFIDAFEQDWTIVFEVLDYFSREQSNIDLWMSRPLVAALSVYKDSLPTKYSSGRAVLSDVLDALHEITHISRENTDDFIAEARSIGPYQPRRPLRFASTHQGSFIENSKIKAAISRYTASVERTQVQKVAKFSQEDPDEGNADDGNSPLVGFNNNANLSNLVD